MSTLRPRDPWHRRRTARAGCLAIAAVPTVERIIGHQRATGGSSGVDFPSKAPQPTCAPELFEVRGVPGQKG